MSHSSKIFDSAPIQVQNRNGFDLSHLNCGTSKCGQLVPVLCKLLPPNSDISLGINMEVNLPPLATSFFGRIDAIVEGFIVPCSILYGGWKQFICNQQGTMFPGSQSPSISTSGYSLPTLVLPVGSDRPASLSSDVSNNNCLFDYLGLPGFSVTPATSEHLRVSMLPFLAYHLICDTFYRNKSVTKTWFSVNPNSLSSSYNSKNVSLVWHSFYSEANISDTSPYSSAFLVTNDSLSSLTFPDGVPIWRTRQRNYARDYFTASSISPQQGSASGLKFSVTDTEGSFTIGALRAANSLQKFLETNNLSGDYADMMRNRWGTRPIDADFDEPYYLGRVVVPVYQHSVYQQDSSGSTGAVNPFAAAGAIGVKGSSGKFQGEGVITKKYHNTTWSYVVCLFSLVPHAMYGLGLNRELLYTHVGDFPAPELQGVGYDDVISSELVYNTSFDTSSVFGYIPRYSRFKYIDDSIHGELRPNRTLHSFVLQRNFSVDDSPILSTSFLQISQDALDDVFAVSSSSMNLSCWYEIYFSFKAVMPLASFCIPTLGDIKDTHTIKVNIGGSRL